MSYSVCLKCKSMVAWYNKYCDECIRDCGLPDLPGFQKENSNDRDKETFDEWAEKEFKKDLEKG